MIPNEVLSPELQVEPLKEGEIAVYRLCASDEIDLSRQDEETGKYRLKSPGYTVAKKYSVYDPKRGRKIIIGNVIGMEQREVPYGKPIDVPKLGNIRFEMGKNVTITSQQNETYQFMERLNINRDNPFRLKGSKDVFYRVNEKRAAQDKNYHNMVLTDALIWIKEATSVEVRTIANALKDNQSLKINLDADWEIVMSRLFDVTMKDPVAVMKASTNVAVKYKLQMMDAAKYQIIIFDDGDASRPRNWTLNRNDRPQIMEVEVGQNKIDALVKFIQTDIGVGYYKSIIAELKLFLKSGAPIGV